MNSIFENARIASRQLALRNASDIDNIILSMADRIEDANDIILAANSQDMARMAPDNPKRDRLLLTPERIKAIASDMRTVAALSSPLGVTLSQVTRPNGLSITKISVPFGVIGIIYEARPNVTFDVWSLCIKAGSACVLKGGSDASSTNTAVVEILRAHLADNGWNPDIVTLLPNDHSATSAMLNAVGYIDLVIPRGSKQLIDFVRQNARVPVIETGAGVCHTYVHSSADIDMARNIVMNAKTRRVSVCNALDTLVIDSSLLEKLSYICMPLADKGVEIYADDRAYAALANVYPRLRHATSDDFGREWLDYKMSVATVSDITEAIDFITAHTSRHSESIVATHQEAKERFLTEIDAACVYANASTAFTDGGQFGFGAEIGISTQKLHARGPMGLPEITTYKYIINGDGQTRI